MRWLAALLFVASPAAAQLNNPGGGMDAAAVAALINPMLPQPATAAPPGVTDASAKGVSLLYALADHTHASKARRDRLQTNAAGVLDVTFTPNFAGTPRCNAIAETASGVTDVINAQIDGTPTTSGMRVRVTRTQISAVALIGLNILSVPASPGVTWVHYLCLEP